MGLNVIPNQPINLEPYSVDDCNHGDGKEYCQLYNSGDIIYLQWQLTPCGNDLVCDPNLRALLSGNNLITNGTFTGNADGWTLGGFTYGANKISASGTSSAYFYQSGITPVSNGTSYALTYTVSAPTNVVLYARFGLTHTPTLLPSTAGTHTVNITLYATSNTATLEIDAYAATPGNFAVTIDDVELETVNSNTCISYDTGYYSSGWEAGADTLCHTAGSSDTIEIDITPVDATGYQQIVIEVTNYEAGSLSVYAGSTQLSWYDTNTSSLSNPLIAGNGIYKFYSTETGNFTISIISSADFVGCVDTINCYEFSRNFSAALTDMNGVLIEDVTADIIYGIDRGMLILDSSDYDEGCYKIAVMDSCADFTGGEEMNTDSSFSSATGWTLTALTVGTIQITGGQLVIECVNDSPPLDFTAVRNTTYPDGDTLYTYEITLDLGILGPSQAVCEAWIMLPDVNGSTYQLIRAMVDTESFDNAVLTYNGIVTVSNGTSGVFHNKIGVYVRVNNATLIDGCILDAASIVLSRVPSDSNSYLSNCLSINDEHDCAKLIQGTAETRFDNYLGFLFGNGLLFRISTRYRLLKINPFYPIDATDHEYSDGSRRINAGKLEKYYELLFDFMDETAMDALSAAALCDYFTIDGDRYFVRPDDIKPEWDKDGRGMLAQVRLIARKRTSTIYKLNG